MFWVFFFFQAEDGIRDLVRSRGLGDVYKRQAKYCVYDFPISSVHLWDSIKHSVDEIVGIDDIETVSYTHLTLPTSDLV